jgi:putative peptidoglycan lipid II flippase
MTEFLEPSLPVSEETRGTLRSASLIALGNVTSRLLGFVRDTVMAGLFGTGAHVDALSLAITIPNQIYDLVTGGFVNSALVPVFSQYAAQERRDELWRLASILATLTAAVVAALIAILTVFTPQVVSLLASLGAAQTSADLPQAASLLRITLPAVIFLSLSGVLSGLLYALKRFTRPAFTAAVFNASMVVVSLALAWRLGVTAMALGLLAGAILQVALQLPALRDARLRPLFTLKHPALAKTLRLYAPVMVGLVISQAAVYFGLGLAWQFTGGLGWMRYATTLYQFPLGLVATAVSFAVLPTLSRQARQMDNAFRGTLVQGINLISALIIPATLGLFLLARPTVALVFQRGVFTAQDTEMTAQVLRFFLLGLSFAAVDQILIFAFYARQDTLTPALVGVLSVVVYVVVALASRESLGLLSLMLADSVKQIVHALVTGALLSRRLQGFRGTGVWTTLGKILLASAIMAALAGLSLWGLQSLPLPSGTLGYAVCVLVPGSLGAAVYVGLASLLGVGEVRMIAGLLIHRLRR